MQYIDNKHWLSLTLVTYLSVSGLRFNISFTYISVGVCTMPGFVKSIVCTETLRSIADPYFRSDILQNIEVCQLKGKSEIKDRYILRYLEYMEND